MAHPSPMPDDIVGEHRVVLRRKQCSDVRFNLVRIFLGRPTESTGEATEVGVHRYPGNVECVTQDDIRGLAAHPGQGHQSIQISGDLTTIFITESLPDALDGLGLLAKETGRRNQCLEFVAVGPGEIRCGGIALKKCGCHFVDALVRALGAQHRCDEQFQRICEVQLAVGIRIGLGERAEDGSGLLAFTRIPRRRRGLHTSKGKPDITPSLRPCPVSCYLLRKNGSRGALHRTLHRKKGRSVDDVLASTALFSALDPEGAAALLSSLQEMRVAKGQELFREGEPGDHLYLILEGKVKLGHGSPDGRESLMAILGPGEMFGELSLFDPGLRTSTATALTDATVLGLGNEQLMPLLEGRPEVAAALLQALARRLRRTNEAMADLVFSDVPGRVAKALMELGEKFGQLTPDGLLVTHDMTQEELAQLVGASRETVNKALAEFGHRGWIKLESRQVLITDVDRLGKRAR